MAEPARRAWRAVAYGALSALLYALLYVWEEQVLWLTTRGGVSLLITIAIAFLFSLVHGAFTGEFWAALGVRPRAVPTPKPARKA